jgi:hypothetical protein
MEVPVPTSAMPKGASRSEDERASLAIGGNRLPWQRRIHPATPVK